METLDKKPDRTIDGIQSWEDIECTGQLEDGTVFAFSKDKPPSDERSDCSGMLKTLSEAIPGMQPGEVKVIRIPAIEAHGLYDDRLVFRVRKEWLDTIRKPQIGDIFRHRTKEGPVYNARVVNLAGDQVILDANHPLSGKDLLFTLKRTGAL